MYNIYLHKYTSLCTFVCAVSYTSATSRHMCAYEYRLSSDFQRFRTRPTCVASNVVFVVRSATKIFIIGKQPQSVRSRMRGSAAGRELIRFTLRNCVLPVAFFAS